MSDQFVGEIRLVAFAFAPQGWAFCLGQLLPLSQNTALFSLLGTTYGGDGRSTFALPNLQGRTALGWTPNGPRGVLSAYDLGQSGGEPAVSLDQSTIPSHTHNVLAVNAPGTTGVVSPNASLAIPRYGRVTERAYSTGQATVPLAADAFAVAGSSQPHNNLQPYLSLNYIIALQGVFPPRP
ncbi:phage tail protein [Leifsonia sp. NCR5]|uniref:phage tail protein n=1 Tax=Leifsonia sp. NCR5 TaxID=1978342 RepID=UPI000A18D518|nr:tail fiber protein [Leifsonia sp. NCR5]